MHSVQYYADKTTQQCPILCGQNHASVSNTERNHATVSNTVRTKYKETIKVYTGTGKCRKCIGTGKLESVHCDWYVIKCIDTVRKCIATGKLESVLLLVRKKVYWYWYVRKCIGTGKLESVIGTGTVRKCIVLVRQKVYWYWTGTLESELVLVSNKVYSDWYVRKCISTGTLESVLCIGTGMLESVFGTGTLQKCIGTGTLESVLVLVCKKCIGTGTLESVLVLKVNCTGMLESILVLVCYKVYWYWYVRKCIGLVRKCISTGMLEVYWDWYVRKCIGTGMLENYLGTGKLESVLVLVRKCIGTGMLESVLVLDLKSVSTGMLEKCIGTGMLESVLNTGKKVYWDWYVERLWDCYIRKCIGTGKKCIGTGMLECRIGTGMLERIITGTLERALAISMLESVLALVQAAHWQLVLVKHWYWYGRKCIGTGKLESALALKVWYWYVRGVSWYWYIRKCIGTGTLESVLVLVHVRKCIGTGTLESVLRYWYVGKCIGTGMLESMMICSALVLVRYKVYWYWYVRKCIGTGMLEIGTGMLKVHWYWYVRKSTGMLKCIGTGMLESVLVLVKKVYWYWYVRKCIGTGKLRKCIGTGMLESVLVLVCKKVYWYWLSVRKCIGTATIPSTTPSTPVPTTTMLIPFKPPTTIAVERCTEWDNWVNLHTPDASGDSEPIAEVKKHSHICINPMKIECRTATGSTADDLGQIISCDLWSGLQCDNMNQFDPNGCADYKVRLACLKQTTQCVDRSWSPWVDERNPITYALGDKEKSGLEYQKASGFCSGGTIHKVECWSTDIGVFHYSTGEVMKCTPIDGMSPLYYHQYQDETMKKRAFFCFDAYLTFS
ncbi:unnamed protein product [Mytilus edulis]|uniref:WxxW domain-containing protein n=1 Tax=Mytilus edulis TaxID=6550 RepID=A0A8S3QIU4_MYTED|nr:unnamed protein product [Mytilus edulis]